MYLESREDYSWLFWVRLWSKVGKSKCEEKEIYYVTVKKKVRDGEWKNG